MGEHSNHLLCLLVFVAVNSRAQIIMVSDKSFSSPFDSLHSHIKFTVYFSGEVTDDL